eukprot:UN25956
MNNLEKAKHFHAREISKLIHKNLYNAIKRIEKRDKPTIPPLINKNNKQIRSDKGKADLLNKIFADNCKTPKESKKQQKKILKKTKQNYTRPPKTKINTNTIPNLENITKNSKIEIKDLNEPIKIQEVRKARLEINAHKAFVGIHPGCLKYPTTPQLDSILCSMFNTWFEHGKLPKIARHATITPIPKPKKPPSNPLSYR